MLIDKVFLKILLIRSFLGVDPRRLMLSFSRYVELKMAEESKKRNTSEINENILRIWEKIQANFVEDTAKGSGRVYDGEQFLRDIRSL
ncbi:hypothetical protein COT51_03840 [candidate division WWE3 bacterium CG08_land_8_20_14_0_20_41_15]|uniref:Uncharacterized protein n=1 Tax=candidate division WWE3 bacterium CG08_land_8_20_14_0_20_41_15 TaxID=1975086 RepID=A0A2H0X8R6_UNCKA|nr:MAG: hypothetical protein COT51_03840 [candidate division WWE3 bacterium CG08_land_8_20_14_0_20_41_15]